MLKLFTPELNWSNAPIGTLGFYGGSSFFSKAIEKLEPGDGASQFTPSHVFIKLDDKHVVEAIQDSHANSVAAISDATKYINALKTANAQLLVPPGNMKIWHDSLIWLVNTYGSEKYGWSVLVGFLVQKTFNLKTNPLGRTGDVCSQAGWIYLQRGLLELGYPHREALAEVLLKVSLSNAAPLNLYQACSQQSFNL